MTRPKVPTTDDEVHKTLVTEGHNSSQLAAWGIYCIKRKQGLSVDDAYMETLDHIIDIAEGRR